jgi:glutamine amidotransferase
VSVSSAYLKEAKNRPEVWGSACCRVWCADSGVVRVPHMGWNSLELRRPSRLLEGLGNAPFTYFAHSYYAPVISSTAAECTYAGPYSAVIEQENLYAVQFHPEKSGEAGLSVIRNFLQI